MSTQRTSDNPRHPKDFPVQAGVPVLSRDGARIGLVEETLPGHFKVDPDGGGSHYWLAKSSLAEANESAAVLSFDGSQLEPYKMDQPAAEAESPILDAANDAFDSEEQLERTRRAMQAGHGAPLRDNAGR